MEVSKEPIMLNKINDLKRYTIKTSLKLHEWYTREGTYDTPAAFEVQDPQWERITVGETWTCKDFTTRWFTKDITIPEAYEGEKVVLLLEFGGEAIVRIDGQIVSALTSYIVPRKATRTRVLVAEKARGGQKIHVCLEAGMNYMEFSGYRRQGHNAIDYTIRHAEMAVVNKGVEDYYFDALTVYESLEVLKNPFEYVMRSNVKLPRDFELFMEACGKDNYLHQRVQKALVKSLSYVDIDFDTDRVLASIPAAKNVLDKELAAIQESLPFTIVFTGHSHIDTAWLWPVKETIRKCAKTFANALSLMDQYPDYVFAHSQPSHYQFVKDYYPDLYERIKQRVQEGRWELIGNTWVEADSNIPSGESLVRQILYGRNFFEKEFGKSSDIYWMPDVFGYSWALPQIIKRSGMKYFYTAKILNNDINRFPHSFFYWQGVDGTKIPAYLQRVSYNSELNPKTVYDEFKRFGDKHVTDKMFVTFGFGDGGGGPTYDMLEFAKRLKSFPGLPKTKIDTASSYFNHIDEHVDDLNVWNDEMYYEFHRGTYTSQANVKKNNRKSELLYREAEILNTMVHRIHGGQYPMEALTDGWKTILLNQFHDIIPGSSINMVYKDCEKDYASVFKIGIEAKQMALAAMADKIKVGRDSIVVFNTLSWERSECIEMALTNDTCQAVMDPSGKILPTSVKETREGKVLSFIAENVPSMGYKVYRLTKKSDHAAGNIRVSDTCLENDFIKVTVFDGNIVGIYDKKRERDILAKGGYANRLIVYEDRPERESAWNIDLEYKNKYWELMETTCVEVSEVNDVKGVLRVVKNFNKSTITQEITIYGHTGRLDFMTTVDWQETEKMLKAEFDVDILSPKATYEIAFGAIERPTHWNTSWDKAKFEVPAHKWADLSEGDYGISLLNDCKYGYNIKDNRMGLTLLRSPVWPDPVADKGSHTFAYALLPHEGDWRQAKTANEGYGFNVPLNAVFIGRSAGAVESVHEYSFLDISKKSVLIDTIKMSEMGDGLIIRVYESIGARGEVTVNMSFDCHDIFECNLMETKERQIEYSGKQFKFSIKPYEIKTFLIT